MISYGGNKLTLIAGEDLSAMQFKYVMQTDDNTAMMHDDGTEVSAGILQNAPAIGEAAVIQYDGISKLVMNDAIAVRVQVKAEYVGAADNGKGDAADTEGDLVQGVCVGASGAEDDVGAVRICLYELSVPA